ncbi:tyrosine-type recombinase/integrase [Cryptosporangium minutisporangium]|uniref:tyrosine-type recombinase/integrase n=1 Tax=Cryptosporangium minutisporangium TaxID=113569 RepID=UPI0031EE778C
MRVRSKEGKVVLVPLPPAVGRALDRAVDERTARPILRNTRGGPMDRHAATRRLKPLATTAGIRMPRTHPHVLRHTLVTTMLDAGVSLRDIQFAARHADPRTTMRYDRARKNLDRHPTTSSPPTWRRERNARARRCRRECMLPAARARNGQAPPWVGRPNHNRPWVVLMKIRTLYGWPLKLRSNRFRSNPAEIGQSDGLSWMMPVEIRSEPVP